MPKTGAGFRVEKPGSKNLTRVSAAGKHFIVKRGVGGNVSRAMKWLIDELHKIEPITEAGWDGTYSYRAVRGGSTWSEHSAGTALDWNASQHPMGGKKTAGWTSAQVKEIRALLATPKGRAFKWGADFSHTPDSMHFELRTPPIWRKHRRLF